MLVGCVALFYLCSLASLLLASGFAYVLGLFVILFDLLGPVGCSARNSAMSDTISFNFSVRSWIFIWVVGEGLLLSAGELFGGGGISGSLSASVSVDEKLLVGDEQ